MFLYGDAAAVQTAHPNVTDVQGWAVPQAHTGLPGNDNSKPGSDVIHTSRFVHSGRISPGILPRDIRHASPSPTGGTAEPNIYGVGGSVLSGACGSPPETH